MNSSVNFDSELSDAEAQLLKAEETHGKDHVQVSYALDRVVEILRRKKMRPLDATNMEARARAIRIKINEAAMSATTRKQFDTSQAIQISAQRSRQQKRNKSLVRLVILGAMVIGIGQTILAPTPAQKDIRDSVVKAVQTFDPAKMLQNHIDKMTDGAKKAAAQEDQHSDEINSYLKQ